MHNAHEQAKAVLAAEWDGHRASLPFACLGVEAPERRPVHARPFVAEGHGAAVLQPHGEPVPVVLQRPVPRLNQGTPEAQHLRQGLEFLPLHTGGGLPHQRPRMRGEAPLRPQRHVFQEGRPASEVPVQQPLSGGGRVDVTLHTERVHCAGEPERPRALESRPELIRCLDPLCLNCIDHRLIALQHRGCLRRQTARRVPEEFVQQRLEVFRARLQGFRVDSLEVQLCVKAAPLGLAQEGILAAADQHDDVVPVLGEDGVDRQEALFHELADDRSLQQLQETPRLRQTDAGPGVVEAHVGERNAPPLPGASVRLAARHGHLVAPQGEETLVAEGRLRQAAELVTKLAPALPQLLRAILACDDRFEGSLEDLLGLILAH
mmetsp:Transcript_1539/g.4995  ORF Transcript_1539/g.4995 Transcript_1539/m.4995 type:complete len:377 (+) Transcript_1539:1662-2792(+)